MPVRTGTVPHRLHVPRAVAVGARRYPARGPLGRRPGRTGLNFAVASSSQHGSPCLHFPSPNSERPDLKRISRTAPPSLALASLVALLPGTACAQGGEGEPAEGSRWGVGIAIVPESRPYRDFDNKTQVWPIVTFENRWLRVLGPGLEVKLGRAGPVSFGFTASYAGDGYEAGDSPVLEGMAKRPLQRMAGRARGLAGRRRDPQRRVGR